MAIAQHDNSYQSEAKKEWREFVYSLATPDNCAQLVDDEGNYNYKWLELVGDNANTFNQLLDTKRIREDQLIGIDLREDNINKCIPLFPKAQFHNIEWNSFCNTYHKHDIGVIVFDSWNAAYGKNFQSALAATMNLALRCKQTIGECLVVINVDASKTHRGYAVHKGLTSEEVLKENIENTFKYSDSVYLRDYKVSTQAMYKYKQHAKATSMLSCGILL